MVSHKTSVCVRTHPRERQLVARNLNILPLKKSVVSKEVI